MTCHPTSIIGVYKLKLRIYSSGSQIVYGLGHCSSLCRPIVILGEPALTRSVGGFTTLPAQSAYVLLTGNVLRVIRWLFSRYFDSYLGRVGLYEEVLSHVTDDSAMSNHRSIDGCQNRSWIGWQCRVLKSIKCLGTRAECSACAWRVESFCAYLPLMWLLFAKLPRKFVNIDWLTAGPCIVAKSGWVLVLQEWNWAVNFWLNV